MESEERSLSIFSRNPAPAPLAQVPGALMPYRHQSGIDADSIQFGTIRRALHRNRWRILLMTVLGAGVGLYLGQREQPVYEARAVMEMQSNGEPGFVDSGGGENRPEISSLQLQTQLNLLRNKSLLDRVYDRLALSKSKEFEQGPEKLNWRQYFGYPPNPVMPKREWARKVLAEKLQVNQVGESRLIELVYRSTDPKLAAAIPNTAAKEFIEENREGRWQSVQQTGEWLTGQLEGLKAGLAESEKQLQASANSVGLLFTGDRGSVGEARLRQLQEEMSRAHADRVAAQSQYEMVRVTPPESLPEVLNDPTLRNFEVKIADLKRELAEFSSLYTAEHYKVKRTEAQLQGLVDIQKLWQARIIDRLKSQYESTRFREQSLMSSFREQSSRVSGESYRAVQYNLMKREVDANRELYESILRRVKEAGVASAMRSSNIRIVDPAITPSTPSGPNPLTMPSAGVVFGLLSGLVFTAIRERKNGGVLEPGLASVATSLPELGVIPRLSVSSGNNGRALGILGLQRNNPVQTAELTNPAWSEPFRATAASLLLMGRTEKGPRKVLVTSSTIGEGKTTVVTNLARVLATAGHKVLIVDADLRRPKVHHAFGLNRSPGIMEMLRQDGALADFVRPTDHTGLSLLTSGVWVDGESDPILSGSLDKVIEKITDGFDFVLIDTPPLLAVSDCRMLARVADGVVLVVSSETTTVDVMNASIRKLQEDGTRIYGFVLNHWDQKRDPSNPYSAYSAGNYYAEDDTKETETAASGVGSRETGSPS